MSLVFSILRRSLKTLIVVASLGGACLFGLSKAGMDVLPPSVTSKLHVYMDEIKDRAAQTKDALAAKIAEHQEESGEAAHEAHHKIVATSPRAQDVIITQDFVCQIHSRRHIEVRALQSGYLQEILVKEGQLVKKGDPMFRIVPTLYKARLDAEVAEADLARMELNYTQRLSDDKVVSPNEVNLHKAKLAKAVAKADLARAELDFTEVRAPFDGMVDRLKEQLGSLIQEGDVLTTLSDNSVMWVYFNVPERRYLEYMTSLKNDKDDQQIELELANFTRFPQVGKIAAIEAKFDNTTGNIPFRADFPNPDGLLRHGQTGKVLIHRTLRDAIVIPQRASFNILSKRYVYVIDKDDVVHQREITPEQELDDIYVLKSTLHVGERIVLEGLRQVRDGDKVEYEFRTPEIVLANLKNKAE